MAQGVGTIPYSRCTCLTLGWWVLGLPECTSSPPAAGMTSPVHMGGVQNLAPADAEAQMAVPMCTSCVSLAYAHLWAESITQTNSVPPSRFCKQGPRPSLGAWTLLLCRLLLGSYGLFPAPLHKRAISAPTPGMWPEPLAASHASWDTDPDICSQCRGNCHGSLV